MQEIINTNLLHCYYHFDSNNLIFVTVKHYNCKMNGFLKLLNHEN